MKPRLVYWINVAIWILLAWFVVLLGLKSLREPDLFWMAATGEWMWQNGQVVKADPFSLLNYGTEWINVKWLFELLVFGVSQLGGMELVPALQMAVNLLLLAVFYLMAKSVFDEFNLVAFAVAALIIFLGLDFRLTGRPETISLLFSAYYLSAWLTWRKHPKSIWLFSLPIVQMLWTNLHEAYATGPIILIILIFSSIGFNFISTKKLDFHAVRKPLLALLFVLLAVVINPRGLTMYLHPLNIFGQVGANKFTTELADFTTPAYWAQKEAFWLVAMSVLALIYFILMAVRNRKSLNATWLAYPILLVAFAYLATTAHRNIAFFLVVVFPVFYLALVHFTGKILLNMNSRLMMLSLLIASFLALGAGKYYELTESKDRIGLGIYPYKNPVGASQWLAQHIDSGTVVFSDYLTSSFLLWNNRPHFKSFIDLRDLDVFSVDQFDQYAVIVNVPKAFEKARNDFGFKIAVIHRLSNDALHRYLAQHPDWTTQYADAVAVVYAHKQANLQGVDLETIWHQEPQLPLSKTASTINNFVNPFFSPVEVLVDQKIEASAYFVMVGNLPLALKFAKAAIDLYPEHERSWLQWAQSQAAVYRFSPNAEERQQAFQTALQAYNKAATSNFYRAQARLGIGTLYFLSGDANNAALWFNKVLAEDEKNKAALSYLAECQNRFMQTDPANTARYVKKWFELMEKANQYHPTDHLIAYRLGISYCARNQLDRAKELLEDMQRLPEHSDQDYANLKACKARLK